MIRGCPRLLAKKHSGREIGERALEVPLFEVDLAAVLPGECGHAGPLVGLGLEDAVSEFGRCLVELSLELLHLRATDATGREFLPRPGEPGLAERRVRDVPGLVETAGEPQQGDLLVERGQAAQLAEFVEALAGGTEIDFFTQGDGVVANDDGQGVFLKRGRPGRAAGENGSPPE